MINHERSDSRYSSHVPARRVVTPSGSIVRGKFPSIKNNRMIRYEGLLEADAILHLELSLAVRKYREQPYKIRYPFDGELRRYTPDFEVLLSENRTVVIEIKHSKFLSKSENKIKYQAIESWFQSKHIDYVIITEQSLRIQNRLSNLRYMYRQISKQRHTQARLKILISSLNESELNTVSSLNAAVAKYQLSAFDFLAAGLVSCNLDQIITPSTELRKFEENGNGWFHICPEFAF